MKKKRFSVEQIVAVLKQAELGMPVAELIRQVDTSERTFYRRRTESHRPPLSMNGFDNCRARLLCFS